jgi:hypothetical protein
MTPEMAEAGRGVLRQFEELVRWAEQLAFVDTESNVNQMASALSKAMYPNLPREVAVQIVRAGIDVVKRTVAEGMLAIRFPESTSTTGENSTTDANKLDEPANNTI